MCCDVLLCVVVVVVVCCVLCVVLLLLCVVVLLLCCCVVVLLCCCVVVLLCCCVVVLLCCCVVVLLCVVVLCVVVFFCCCCCFTVSLFFNACDVTTKLAPDTPSPRRNKQLGHAESHPLNVFNKTLGCSRDRVSSGLSALIRCIPLHKRRPAQSGTSVPPCTFPNPSALVATSG